MSSLTVDVTDLNGKKSGQAELPAELFGVEPNIPLIHQVVVAQLAAARQGTHKTKGRGEVRGGGAKPWRQKGTGRARQGSRRAPQWTGGGIVHGPTPRDYSQRTPKKMVVAALRGALSDRAAEGRVHVVNNLVEGNTPSTRKALAAINAVAQTTKVLVVLARDEDVAWLSLRNAATVHALAVDQLNAYDVLVADEVVFTAAALEAFVAGPTKGKGAKSVATSEETAEPTNAELQAATLVSETEDTAEPTNEQLAAESDKKDYGKGSYRGENPPKGFDIKGNEDSMKFHTPESQWYDATVAEVWFDSEAAAEAAGFVNVLKGKESK
ncbi:50S ribosomal protein L4 [Naumannella sp. ID2617S]|uniref:Large ribosomal subunit protein uL4 n=1 Tax=Enemella dayhoffiae TaxID=2016507 RepID=A0A255H3D9_9ACTN|nr:50S ribosomal protein L4 [Enemella dayhoffiae]NNG18087.1 50S ribosomal protein L4 [Naumannella sp. ID2617S]OYO21094.1 50S ribosomal protein L4 [Enemella dayhoffiae]